MIRLIIFCIVSITALFSYEKDEVKFDAGEIHYLSQKYQLPEFFIDRYEVSNSQYEKFVNQSGVNPALSFAHDKFNSENQPVSGIDWFDASLYCRLQGKRLPRMIELIRAAQGQVPKLYPFGKNFPSGSKAPFITHSHKPISTSSINSFAEFRSDAEVFNLAGNVAEWTSDSSRQSLAITSNNTVDLKALNQGIKVYGGSYVSSVHGVKVGSFEIINPTERFHLDVGFRCARDANQQIIDKSNLITMNSQNINDLIHGKNLSQKDMLNKSTQDRIEKVKTEQKLADEQERKTRLKNKSLALLKSRENSVSEEYLATTSSRLVIPYGIFMMGDDESSLSTPQRLIYLDAYEIDINLVTSKQFSDYLSSNKITVPYDYRPLNSNPDANLAYVTWIDARSYCRHQTMDLPSEAQWEKAVRGLSLEKIIKMDEKGLPIGYFGIKQVHLGYDEWTLDTFAPYEMSESLKGYRNPVMNLNHGSFKVFRGSLNPSESTHLTDRKASHMRALHAFRCVKNLGQEGKPPFEINREMNYFMPDFFEEIRTKIKDGKNPLNVKIDMGEFERDD